MINRLLGLLFFVAMLAVIGMNFKPLLTFSQEKLVRNAAQKAVEIQNWEKAINVYETGLKEYPDNTLIAMRLGRLYARANQPDKAESIYQQVLKLQPANLDAQIGLASLLAQDPARINEAVDLLRQALRANPDNPRLLAHVGQLYKTAAENPLETRRKTRRWLYDQSRYYYQLALKLDPNQFQGQFNLGVAYQYLDELKPASAAYCRAVILNPDSYEARYNLGLTLSDLNYLEESYRQLDRSVQILSEEGDMTAAQELARRVQMVKNANYLDVDKRGLAPQPAPDFLDKRCLYQLKSAARKQRS